MPSILREISEWGATLPYWEQAALDKIIGGIEITPEVIEELYRYLIEDAGLKSVPIGTRPILCNLHPETGEAVISSERPLLKRIYNLKNINALVPNQELSFGSQLTVIFGANGAGKSGYARVIGCAAFTRGDKEILPDVTRTQVSSDPPSADIDLLYGEEIRPIHYVIGENCPQLSSFYTFDSTSVKNHLTKENPMSFSPGGLEVLSKLTTVTDRVRKRLEIECANRQAQNIYTSLFFGESQVSTILASLSADSNIEEIKRLAKISDEELESIPALELEIANLKNQKISEQIQELSQIIADLNLLIDGLEKISASLSDEVVSDINNKMVTWGKTKKLTQTSGVESFKTEYFTQVGSEIWEKFIWAAYNLGQSESIDYPAKRDRCLLCHQPLTVEARDLVLRTWEYLQSETQQNLDRLEEDLQQRSNYIKELDFGILNDQTVCYRYLSADNQEIVDHISSFLKESAVRKARITRAINEHQICQTDKLPDSCSDLLQTLVEALKTEKERLENRKVDEEIKKLEIEIRELEHRKILSEHLVSILEFVSAAKWIQKANLPKTRRSTKHITQKYNDLFDQLVTQEYIHLFENTLIKLKCPLGVKVTTHGSKGQTWKQIALKREDEQVISGTTPDQVLSEGEQRAVALADFLTEVALDENSAGILLDDPVSSLDFDWKEIIAQQIADEARRQQVIVLTHDLHFYSLLIQMAGENIKILTNQIKKINNKPGWVFTDTGLISEREFRTPAKAKLCLEKAQQVDMANTEEQQIYLCSGFGYLRTTYEVFIQHELFRDVVLRFQERISGDRFRNVYIDPGIRDEVYEAMGRLSRYIDAHSHSDLSVGQPPTILMLEEEIRRFEVLVERNKKIRKDLKLDS